MNPIDTLALTLRQHGRSITVQRRQVFDALQTAQPLTMHEIVARCSDVDRASVYRTITLFERLGIVLRLQTGWKYRLELSDTFLAHHHHATCLQCGRIISLHEDTKLERLLHSVAAQHQFSLTGHQIELRGYCHDCTPEIL